MSYETLANKAIDNHPVYVDISNWSLSLVEPCIICGESNKKNLLISIVTNPEYDYTTDIYICDDCLREKVVNGLLSLPNTWD